MERRAGGWVGRRRNSWRWQVTAGRARRGPGRGGGTSGPLGHLWGSRPTSAGLARSRDGESDLRHPRVGRGRRASQEMTSEACVWGGGGLCPAGATGAVVPAWRGGGRGGGWERGRAQLGRAGRRGSQTEGARSLGALRHICWPPGLSCPQAGWSHQFWFLNDCSFRRLSWGCSDLPLRQASYILSFKFQMLGKWFFFF